LDLLEFIGITRSQGVINAMYHIHYRKHPSMKK
jgi:hypothetical protein